MSVYDLITSSACGCDDPALVAPLMSVSDALQAGLDLAVVRTETEELPLVQARGRVLARPVQAQADMPGFDNSGMDGYAICTRDLSGDGAVDLPVVGVSAAGTAPAQLVPGSMMRIYTGAPVPEGADAVVMQELTEPTKDGKLALLTRPNRGENIRRRGEDQKRGSRVLDAGCLLDAKAIAVCAGAGVGRVQVYRRLRVALVLTGDELVPAGDPLRDGAIWDVNTPMLHSLIDCGWAEITGVHRVVDDRAALIAALDTLADKVDIIVTSGGVSVGDRDHVKPSLAQLGADIRVSGVAIKPGKPITLSGLRDCVVVSLPGNPVSALVTWLVFGAPIAARMTGLTQTTQRRRHVRATGPVQHKTGRCEYRPAQISGYGSDGLEVITTGAHTHSAQLLPLATADGLVLIPGETDRLEMGDLMEFLPFPA